MSLLTKAILETVRAKEEGAVLSPKEFLHIGSRAAVDQAFTRLTRARSLVRVSRGLYARPVATRFGERPPSAESVIRGIETIEHEKLVPHGAAAANALGLTTQVPMREVYMTPGRPRTISLGKQRIEIKRAPRWQFALGQRPAGEALRALGWIGPHHVRSALLKLRKELAEPEWNAILSVRSLLPGWLARSISQVE